MEGKMISLQDSVEEIVGKHPEAVHILQELGFSSIGNPLMLSTMGRFMTLPKAAVMKKVSLDEIKEAFRKNGIEVMD